MIEKDFNRGPSAVSVVNRKKEREVVDVKPETQRPSAPKHTKQTQFVQTKSGLLRLAPTKYT